MRIGKLVIAGTIVGMSVVPAHADIYTDKAECKERAAIMTESGTARSTQNAAINGGARLLGALIGHRNRGYAAESAARGVVYGTASDARRQTAREDTLFNQCMRQKQVERSR